MKLDGRCRSPSLPGTGRGTAKRWVGCGSRAQRLSMRQLPTHERLLAIGSAPGNSQANWGRGIEIAHIVDFVGRTPPTATRSPLPVPGRDGALDQPRRQRSVVSVLDGAPPSSRTHQGNESGRRRECVVSWNRWSRKAQGAKLATAKRVEAAAAGRAVQVAQADQFAATV